MLQSIEFPEIKFNWKPHLKQFTKNLRQKWEKFACRCIVFVCPCFFLFLALLWDYSKKMTNTFSIVFHFYATRDNFPMHETKTIIFSISAIWLNINHSSSEVISIFFDKNFGHISFSSNFMYLNCFIILPSGKKSWMHASLTGTNMSFCECELIQMTIFRRQMKFQIKSVDRMILIILFVSIIH